MAVMGVDTPRLRMRRDASYPSIRGIIISIKIRSYVPGPVFSMDSMISTASKPSEAVSTVSLPVHFIVFNQQDSLVIVKGRF